MAGKKGKKNTTQDQPVAVVPQKQKKSQVMPGNSHSHGHGQQESHDHSQCGGHHHEQQKQIPTQDLLAQLAEFNPQIKPEDPLPNFDHFNQSKEQIQAMIEDFQNTIKQIQGKKYAELGIPNVIEEEKNETNNKAKLHQPNAIKKKQQQVQKEKNLSDLKAKTEIFIKHQNELEKQLENPLQQEIQDDIRVAIQNIKEDIKDSNDLYQLIELIY